LELGEDLIPFAIPYAYLPYLPYLKAGNSQ
jgi:hypothetical protein